MNKEQIISELKFQTSRSSGAGGQHVNKTETKVAISFKPFESMGLTEKEKSILKSNLKLDDEAEIRMSCQETRSQTRNKNLVVERLFAYLEANLISKRKRKKTAIPAAVKAKRAMDKKHRSETKSLRKPPGIGDN